MFSDILEEINQKGEKNMSKITASLVLSLFLVSMASAQYLIGAKAGGMGGAGVANVADLAAVYYNPAALMESDVSAGEMKLSLGVTYTDPTELSNALSKANDAATFLVDNYSKSLSFNGNVSGILGFNIKKVGISVLPIGDARVSKSANSLVGGVTAEGQYAGVITLGQTFSVPYLPAALDVGINAKVISAYLGGITTTGTATNASGTRTYSTGSGMGFDLGVLTSFDVPMVTSFKAGIVARNIAQSVKYTNKSQKSYLDYSSGTGTVTTEAEQSLPETTATADPSYAIGASAFIPGANLSVAGDIEIVNSRSNTHLGLEYPLVLNTLLVRAGFASGNNLSKTTLGAKINLPIFTLDVVAVSDANNQGATSYIADINLGW
jgi:hypothetical protein